MRSAGFAGSMVTGDALWRKADESGSPVRVTVHRDRPMGAIPKDFTGLGYEISSVARPGLLSGSNRAYVQMVRTLGAQGVIRVGGNTADYASYSKDGAAVSVPKGTVVNDKNLRELRSFLDATGWQLIWSVDLGEGTAEKAAEEAAAVAAATGERLLALEIGNEVDLFSHEGHRPAGYSFAQYLEEYRRYKRAIRAKLPGVPFAGPDIAGKTDWVTQFAEAEGKDLRLLTHHYYRGGQSPASSFDMLLHPDPKLAPTLATLRQASESSHVPCRICEVNSFSGGGRPGVSGTMGAGLWVLDYMYTLASAGMAGVNIETGVNQLGFVSSYSPIGDDEHGTYHAQPEFYGMLAFAQGSQGDLLTVDVETGGVNLTAYAAAPGRERATVTVINKDASRGAEVSVLTDGGFRRATVMRMEAPTLNSATGVTLGGAAVTPGGEWRGAHTEAAEVRGREVRVSVRAGSAALVMMTS